MTLFVSAFLKNRGPQLFDENSYSLCYLGVCHSFWHCQQTDGQNVIKLGRKVKFSAQIIFFKLWFAYLFSFGSYPE